jgi:hypothetical protein
MEDTGTIMNNLKELRMEGNLARISIEKSYNKQSIKTSLMESHKNNTFDVSCVSSIKAISNINESPSTEAA